MNIRIREWYSNDLTSLILNANNPKIGTQLRNSFPYPYQEKDGLFFLDICEKADKTKDLFLAITVDDHAIGGIALSFKEDVNCKCAELGYWLGEAYWSRGIATEAVKQICSLGFEQYDIIRIYAEFFETNQASQKVLEKNGFIFEGRLRKSIFKNNEIYDSFIYGLVI